ncbi:hypothetical protein [Tateyamaria sp. SN6-1]|uniref:hypothetical protein n=1 Tax=Tateyamaria sp. SN6-1 TaxID=3092148 RepID=UPI0039F62AAC
MSRADRERIARERALALIEIAYDGLGRTLRIVVDGTRESDETEPPNTGDAAIDRAIGPARAISVLPGCRRYTVRFADVVAVQIRDESYATPEPGDTSTSPLRR